METISHLDITGYRNLPVPNTYWRQPSSDRVAIVLPGYGYSADMPVLYYPGRAALERGADLLQVQYAYNLNAAYRQQTDEEQMRWLVEDSQAACREVFSRREYRRVTLIGKSLGTMAMARLLPADPGFDHAACVWLTPVLSDPQVERLILSSDRKSLLVIGTADSFYHPEMIAQIQRKENTQVMVIPDADHSLEIKGDIVRSIKIMEKLVEQMISFMEA